MAKLNYWYGDALASNGRDTLQVLVAPGSGLGNLKAAGTPGDPPRAFTTEELSSATKTSPIGQVNRQTMTVTHCRAVGGDIWIKAVESGGIAAVVNGDDCVLVPSGQAVAMTVPAGWVISAINAA